MKKAMKICSQYLFVFFLLVPASLFGETITVYEENFDSPWNTGDWDQYTPEGGAWATQLPPFICQGDQSVSHWDNGEPVNGWIISNLISLQASITYTCSFQQRVGNSSFPENMGTYIYQGNGVDFAPGTATAVIWQADNLTNETCSSRSNTFTVPSDGNYNIVFHCTSAANEFIAIWDYVKITRPTPATTTSFTPTTGSAGTTVTITGTNFTGATAVKFGGTDAQSYTVVSAIQITAVVGNGSSGNVTVTTPGGTATSASTFTYIPAPTITSFTPTTASTGVTVTITGTNFTGTEVKFGGTDAASFSVVSPTQITAVVGAGATGKITVTTDGGTATSASTFTYTPTPIPTLNEWGLIGLSLLLIGIGYITIRRRQRACV